MTRRLKHAVCAGVLPGVLLCRLASAQVGPSGESVKPVGPSNGSIKKPVKPTSGAAAPRVIIREKVRVKPVYVKVAPPPPDPRLLAARKWQDEELKALQTARTILDLLQASRIDKVAYPLEPPVPAVPQPELVPVQKVALTFTREDGAPFDAKQVKLDAKGFQLRSQASTLELEGPASAAEQDLILGLPSDYSLVHPGDGRIALKSNPGTETRLQLEPRAVPAPPPPPVQPRLFATELERDALRQKIFRMTRATPQKPVKAPLYPTPAAQTSAALRRLVDARRFLEPVAPIAPTASADTRRAAWGNLEEALRLLGESEAALVNAQRTVDKLAADRRPRQWLKGEYRIRTEEIAGVLKTARMRRLQYIAEAQWWRAVCEDPASPDRSAAINTLREALKLDPRAPETTAQLARYEEVAEREGEVRQRLASGFYNPRPIPRIQVVRQFVKTVKVRREVVDLRVAENELRAGDQVTIGGDPKKPIAFQLQNGYWRARVPRSLLKAGDTLRVNRQTANSDLEAEAPITAVDPYNLEGNEVSRGAMRLAILRTYELASSSPENRIAVLEELEPTDQEKAKLKDARKRGARDVRASEDGSWWIPAGSGQLMLRLRPSPYPEGGPSAGGRPNDSLGARVEKNVTSFFKKITGRSERNRSLMGRVIVDTARLEGPNDGHVAGVKVGSTEQQVEDALGGRVPRNGVVRYGNGALEIAMRAGTVETIEIRRDLEDLLNKPLPNSTVGVVTEIKHDMNRLRARTGADLPAQPGTEFEVLVAGKPLSENREGESLRAIVLDAAGNEVVCKLVRKNKAGAVAGDAAWDVLRSLPTGDSGVVQLRRPL